MADDSWESAHEKLRFLNNKYEPSVVEVHVNPDYALVRLPDKKDSIVSLRHVDAVGKSVTIVANSPIRNSDVNNIQKSEDTLP